MGRPVAAAYPERLWKGHPMTSSTKLIPLTQGFHAIVDAEDYDALSAFKWCVRPAGRRFYAQRGYAKEDKSWTTMQMHRQIMSATPEMMVDHINHDGLDNRRENLRLCSRLENCRNKRSAIGTSSQFLGVTWDKKSYKWRTRITVDGHRRLIGFFNSEIKAAIAYDNAARKYFGEFANPNFPAKP